MDLTDFERRCDESYGKVFLTAFLILGDREEALDVAQETFARAYERWSTVRAMENPEGWLLKVAVNRSLSLKRRIRTAARHTSRPGVAAAPEAAEPALAAAMATLTPAQRAAVIVRYHLDRSVDETAALLGKRPGTVRALTSQGIGRLRDALGPDFMEERDERPVP